MNLLPSRGGLASAPGPASRAWRTVARAPRGTPPRAPSTQLVVPTDRPERGTTPVRRPRSSARLDGQAQLPPGLEAAFQVGDVRVAESCQRCRGQGGAAARRAVEDHAPLGLELLAMVRAGRVRGELEHPTHGVNRAPGRALRAEL